MTFQPALKDYIDGARWFGGKGRDWEVGRIRRVGTLPGSTRDLTVVIDLVEIAYADGEPDFYQVPLALYPEQQDRLGHALIGPSTSTVTFAYDAVHDREAMALWLQAFASAADGKVTADDLAFHRIAGHDLDTEAHSTLFTGEQSNSSVLFGEDSLMKVFRKVTPGVNPDVSIHEVLTRAGSDHVAALFGWLDFVDMDADGVYSTIQLAMLQQFLRTATDGWELALASVRNLFAEADLHAEEVGGDFAGEAARLGRALAETHETLAEHFPVAVLSADETSALADAMRDRLRRGDRRRASARGPCGRADCDVRRPRRPGRRARAADPRRPAPGPDAAHRQGLEDRRLRGRARQAAGRAPPARLALARRRRHAALLRLRAERGADDQLRRRRAESEEKQQAYRAAEWSARNAAAFLASYADRALTPTEQTLLDAYVADKAVYEAVYEARNRPAWVDIPLDALARLSQSRTESS